MTTFNHYALADPRDPDPLMAIRYVGRTIEPIRRRHSVRLCRSRRGDTDRCSQWIRDLFARGLTPTLIDLGQGDSSREMEIVAEMEFAGVSLLNTRLWSNSAPGMTLAAFWSRVDRSGHTPSHRPELGPCWHYIVRQGKGTGKPKDAAARWAYRRFGTQTGLPPKTSVQINHHCDNGFCLRPDHVYWGTQQDNRNDSVRRGRVARGAAHAAAVDNSRNIGASHWSARHPDWTVRGSAIGTSVLNEWQVVGIMARALMGAQSRMSLAREVGISYTTMKRIWGGEIWGHLWKEAPDA